VETVSEHIQEKPRALSSLRALIFKAFRLNVTKWSMIAGLTYLILVAVSVIGAGFKLASGGSSGAQELLGFATNPFVGLISGFLATALVQSSSTVTSVIVGLVAGGLPVSMAIPMIMGANLGTTITNTLVSLGHVKDRTEFKQAFSAATVHDFFNILAVALFLPLELSFGLLEKTSSWVMSFLTLGGANVSMKHLNFIKPLTKPTVAGIQSLLTELPNLIAGGLMTLIGICMIFFAIFFLGKILKSVMVGRAREILHRAIGRGPLAGIASGTLMTILVQSSSTTTSLAVPLAGTGIFKVKDLYPFTLGANIGTCVTALLAATAVTGGSAQFAMQIAIVHLLFNLFGVAIIFGIPFLRNLPLKCADFLADIAIRKKSVAIAYILGVFFLLPGAVIGLSSTF
jgi:sodium-dependent phosphate cotransporter